MQERLKKRNDFLKREVWVGDDLVKNLIQIKDVWSLDGQREAIIFQSKLCPTWTAWSRRSQDERRSVDCWCASLNFNSKSQSFTDQATKHSTPTNLAAANRTAWVLWQNAHQTCLCGHLVSSSWALLSFNSRSLTDQLNCVIKWKGSAFGWKQFYCDQQVGRARDASSRLGTVATATMLGTALYRAERYVPHWQCSPA